MKLQLVKKILCLVLVFVLAMLFSSSPGQVDVSWARLSQDPAGDEADTGAALARLGDILLEDIVVLAPPRIKKKKPDTPEPEVAAASQRLVSSRDERPAVREDIPERSQNAQDSVLDLPFASRASGPSGTGSPGAGDASAGRMDSSGTGGLEPGQAVADLRAVDQKLIPASVTVIERESFEGQVENVAEVIEREAGVQVRQSGGLGSFSTVSLRGSTSDQVMIFLDGILLNDASGGGVDLSNISLADVETIEIYRGVTPINFGKASVGGAVNIKTLRTRKGFKASVGAGYGSFNTQKIFGYVNHKPGKWDYLVSADYLGSDNNFEFLNDRGTEWNTADDRWEERNNADFAQYNLLAKFGYDFNPRFRWDVTGQFFSKDQGLPNWINTPQSDTRLGTRRGIFSTRFALQKFTPLSLDTELRLDYSQKEEEYDDRQGYVGLGRQHSKYTTTRFGAGLFTKWNTDRQTMSFLVEAMHEDYRPEDLLQNDPPHDSSRDLLNLGLQDSIKFFNQRLIVTPAIRYTWLKDVLESGSDVWGYTFEESTREDTYASPQLGVKFSPVKWLTLRANVAQYVREPSFFELFGDRGFFIGNEDLRAEKGLNTDIGFSLNWFPDLALLDRISLNMSYFDSDVEDLITRVYDARGVGRSVNISDSNIHGVETDMNIGLFKYFSLIGKYTWQDSENKSMIGAFAGKQLPGRFRDSWLGRVEAKYAGFKLFGEYVYEKGLYYDTANLVEAETKKEFNAGLSYLFRSCLFSLEGKNLTDKQYEDFNGYPLPGRAFYFTVKYDF